MWRFYARFCWNLGFCMVMHEHKRRSRNSPSCGEAGFWLRATLAKGWVAVVDGVAFQDAPPGIRWSFSGRTWSFWVVLFWSWRVPFSADQGWRSWSALLANAAKIWKIAEGSSCLFAWLFWSKRCDMLGFLLFLFKQPICLWWMQLSQLRVIRKD